MQDDYKTWTAVKLDSDVMEIYRWDPNNTGLYTEHMRCPDDMLRWLRRETGEAQASMISDSQWVWDIEPGFPLFFYFRDKDVALKFKLTWGTHGLQA